MAERQIVIRRNLSKETRIQNSIIWDDNISTMARFTLIAMLSMREGWDYSVRGMATMLHFSKDTMSKYIRELEGAGYLKREQGHSEKGKFAKAIYILTDTPGDFGEEETCPENYDTDDMCHKKSAPVTSAPTESPQQIRSIKQQKRKEKTTTPTPPQEGVPARKRKQSNEPKKAPDWKPERFEGLWQVYPCGKSKQAAIKAWDKLQPDDELLVLMAKGLNRALHSEEWQRGIGIPHLSTWLNQRRWEDEERAVPSAQPVAPLTPERFGWD